MAIGLVLGGGAPNLPLMTGALLALDEADVEFKVITTTGAGMVVGLLYAAPRKKDDSQSWADARRAALKATREWGIDDLIYEAVPVNYKIFQKPGMLARAYSHATNPYLWSIPRGSRRQRLLGDTMSLMAAAMSPSDLKPSSRGLCQPPPWIEMIVDFDMLKENLAEPDIKFRLSAYCIEDEDEKTFHKKDISAGHFKAALAMPFIYAPYRLKDKDGEWKTYLEGSAFNTLALDPDKVMAENDIDTVIFFDIMGNRNLIGEPRWLIDAWGKSIVAPLTRLAEQGIGSFKMKRELNEKKREIADLDKLLDLAEQGDELLGLKRRLHMKNRQLAELMDLKRLARYTNQEKQVFTRRLVEYVETYLPEKEIKDPEDLVREVPEDLLREIKELEGQIPGRKDGDPSTAEKARKADEDRQFDRSELLRMPFRDNISEEQWPKVLDWSYTNMSELFDIGYKTGKKFAKDHGKRLQASMNHKEN